MRTLEIKHGTFRAPIVSTVPAYFSKCGLLAVHKRFTKEWSRSYGWVITHVPTGLEIGCRATRGEAIAIRRALEGIRCPTVERSPWDFTDEKPVHLGQLGDLADRACLSVDGWGRHV